MGGSDSHKTKQQGNVRWGIHFQVFKGGIWYLIKNQINK
jgi:hypothetical protein